MQTGWLKDNGYWYFLNKTGEMLTGWIELSQGTYYCDSSGKMIASRWMKLTPPRKIYGHSYEEDPYWAYFNSSGLMLTDSDCEGCSTGLNDFSHGSYAGTLSNIRYYIGTDTSVSTASFTSGMNLWENGTVADFTRTYNDSIADLYFLNYPDPDDPTTRAFTAVFDENFNNFHRSRSNNENWRYGAIYFNTRDHSDIGPDTVAHEIGHFFGLSHRITELDSIMQKFHFNFDDQSLMNEYNYKYLSDDDLAVFHHIND